MLRQQSGQDSKAGNAEYKIFRESTLQCPDFGDVLRIDNFFPSV
jgi:hypothetical protein